MTPCLPRALHCEIKRCMIAILICWNEVLLSHCYSIAFVYWNGSSLRPAQDEVVHVQEIRHRSSSNFFARDSRQIARVICSWPQVRRTSLHPPRVVRSGPKWTKPSRGSHTNGGGSEPTTLVPSISFPLRSRWNGTPIDTFPRTGGDPGRTLVQNRAGSGSEPGRFGFGPFHVRSSLGTDRGDVSEVFYHLATDVPSVMFTRG